jgi:predicted nucleotide-binding protein
MPARRSRSRNEAPDNAAPQLRTSVQDAWDRLDAKIAAGKNMLQIAISDEATMKEAKAKFDSWSEFNGSLLEHLFTTNGPATEYRRARAKILGRKSLLDRTEDFHEDVQDRIRKLESIRDRLELWEAPTSEVATLELSSLDPQETDSRIFIVHGHDEAAKESVARFIEHLLGTKPVILNEQAHQGITLIEKLERYRNIGYAVVLLTPDDIGGVKDSERDSLRLRPRQNVVLELGFFIGALGRDRVCTLYKREIEMPTDYVGSGYIAMDAGGGWKMGLARELKAANFAVDLNWDL